MADITVLLPSRPLGGHEKALLHWLQDATQGQALRPAILGADDAFAAACGRAGLQSALVPRSGLEDAPRGVPLLLAPGVLHMQAWLLCAALAKQHEVWVYVAMAYSARAMGYRHSSLRDALLAPWLRRVRGWITINEHQQALLRDEWKIRAPIHVLPNQTDTHAPMLPAAAPVARLRVAVVGRFDPWQKGLDWLAAQITNQAPWTLSCQWVFQGAGAAEAMLMQLASRLGPHRVQVRAHAPLAEALASADVLLMPSRYEGLPLVALEASVMGRAVVASEGACLQSLLPGSSQFVFGDAAGLARALASLATPESRQRAVAHAQGRLAFVMQREKYDATLQALAHSLGGQGRP